MTARYTIPAAVDALLRRESESEFRPYLTTRERTFDRCDSYSPETKRFLFRDGGWVLSVLARDVKQPERPTVQREPWEVGFPCPWCDSYLTEQRVVQFAIGQGVRLVCGGCHLHLKWLNHEDLAVVE